MIAQIAGAVAGPVQANSKCACGADAGSQHGGHLAAAGKKHLFRQKRCATEKFPVIIDYTA